MDRMRLGAFRSRNCDLRESPGVSDDSGGGGGGGGGTTSSAVGDREGAHSEFRRRVLSLVSNSADSD
jgi:hypothetical protein